MSGITNNSTATDREPTVHPGIAPNTEIRKLSAVDHSKLVQFLETSENWKNLMSLVLKEGTDRPKFSADTYEMIKNASSVQKRSGAEIFLEEWGTMGRNRPTLKSTLDLLVKAQLFRAADYIAQDLLKIKRPERPMNGPAKEIKIPDVCAWSASNDSKQTLKDALEKIHYPSDISAQNENKAPTHHHHPNNNSNLIVFSTDIGRITDQQNKDTPNQNANRYLEAEVICRPQELTTCELPTVLADMIGNTMSSSELDSKDIPIFVKEISAGKPGQPILSNDSNPNHSIVFNSSEQSEPRSVSPIHVPNFNDCTSIDIPVYRNSFTNDSTEGTSIAVCVNDFQKSENNLELKSSELPIFLEAYSLNTGRTNFLNSMCTDHDSSNTDPR